MTFTGVGVALVTLFDDEGRLLPAETAELATSLVDLGVRAVVVAGTTGEAAQLSPQERDALLAAVVGAVGGRVPVVAGTGGPAADAAVALTELACAGGADAVLVLSPPGADDVDIRRYYDAVAAAATVPVLAYHFPKVSPPGIAVELLSDLPVDGIKDSTGDGDRLVAELATGVPVYVGAAPLLALAGPLGAAGAIMAIANAEPEACVAAFAGDIEAQRRVNAAYLQARDRAAGIAGLKRLVAARFRTPAATRRGPVTSSSALHAK